MDFLDEELEEILNIFQQESSEILETMDKNLLIMEKDPKHPEAILHLFRNAHSLKGSARMLNFTNIQNVAHKIEDVLGLIKEKKMDLTPEIAETISEALECISEMISKTVEQKREFVSPKVSFHLQNLENIVNREQSTVEEATVKPKPESSLQKSINQIEALVIESIYMFSKFKTEGIAENFEEINIKLNELYGISEKINNADFETAVSKAISAILIVQNPKDENFEKNIANLNSALEEIALKSAEVCRNNGLEPKNYYGLAGEKLLKSEDRKELPNKTEETGYKDADKLEDLLEGLLKNINYSKTNANSLQEIKPSINEILQKTDNDNVNLRRLYNTLLRTFENQESTGRNFSKDVLNALSEIVRDSLSIVKKNHDNAQLDVALLIQRALIIEQMTQIGAGEREYALAQKQSQRPVQQGESQEGFSSQDWLNSIDSSSIKTLRINSSKLDQLVNQVGDLIVTRIKTKEQLNLSKNIQKEFEEWQKSWHKVGHYIKYFDKKYLAGASTITKEMQSTMVYNKQLMSLYNTHSDKMNELMDASQYLYRQLQENDAKLNLITTELEAMVKNMRVLPLATIFHLFPRMVHNIARDKEKEIDFRVAGSDVSVDKKIIEDIKIPLMHIIRNSIDHGIETPEERKNAGKNPTGSILVRASHRENKIIIDIEDDGRGIDVQKIKEKALKKGLLTEDEANTLPEEQIVSLIFYPGFSTEEVVTELSGRGLGLDIVHTKISQLNGRIDIRSQFNRGTITTITLPATMATIKSFIISEQGQSFAIPTAAIETVLRIRPEEILVKEEKTYFIHNKRIIPIFTLSQILQFEEASREGDKYTLMILESESTAAGIIVDKLLGDQEILHKKLSLPLFKVKNVSGITTLASGETCLILNVVDILNNAVPKKFSTFLASTTKSLALQKNSQYKILVVDDSLTTRTLQRNILTGEGYQVYFATNALDALKMIDTEHPNLVVTDNEMPNMTGLELVEKIREERSYTELPIIVLTSLSKEGWQDKFFKAGAQKYIQKGEFDQEYFLECISDLLGKNGL